MRIAVLASFILAALTTTVAARAHVPRTLLVGLKRQAPVTPVIPNADGGACPSESQTACGDGTAPQGCCEDDANCEFSEDQSAYTCVGPEPLDPEPIAEGTEPTPDDNGTCEDGAEYCPTGGCCATTCLAADAEASTYVCEIVIDDPVPPSEETTSTRPIPTTTRVPPTVHNTPTPTRSRGPSTTTSRTAGASSTSAPGDGAGSVSGKAAAVVAGVVGAMMALA